MVDGLPGLEPGSPALSPTAFSRWLRGSRGNSASASCTELAGRPLGAPECREVNRRVSGAGVMPRASRRTGGRPGRPGVWAPLEDAPQLPRALVELVCLSSAESPQKLCGHLGHHDLSSSSPSATTSPSLPQPGLAPAFWSGAGPPSSPTGAGQGPCGQRMSGCQDGGPSSGERGGGCRRLSLRFGQSQGRRRRSTAWPRHSPAAPPRVPRWPPGARVVPTEGRWPGESEALAGLSLPGHRAEREWGRGPPHSSRDPTRVWSQEWWALSPEQPPPSPLTCQAEPEQGFWSGFLCLPYNRSP